MQPLTLPQCAKRQRPAHSHAVQFHTHARFLRSKKWPTYCNRTMTGNVLALQRSIFEDDCFKFSTFIHRWIGEFVCSANNHSSSEMSSNRHKHTQTHKSSTVTLVAHACRGLITKLLESPIIDGPEVPEATIIPTMLLTLSGCGQRSYIDATMIIIIYRSYHEWREKNIRTGKNDTCVITDMIA